MSRGDAFWWHDCFGVGVYLLGMLVGAWEVVVVAGCCGLVRMEIECSFWIIIFLRMKFWSRDVGIYQ